MKIMTLLKNFKLPMLGVIGLVFALVSVVSQPTKAAKQPMFKPATTPYEQAIAGIGVVEPRSEVINLSVDMPGVVRVIHVKVGDQVIKNAPLFTLDERDVNARIATLEANLVSARIMAEDAAEQFALIESVRDKRAVAKDDYNRRKFAAQLAKAKVAEIEAQLDQARTTKDQLTVRAPINGEVLDINIRPGEYASVGNLQEPIMRMGDTSRLHVRVEIDEEYAAYVKPSYGATGFVRSDTSNKLPLAFVRFEPYVQAKQNLAAAGQRVDTRVLQVIYALKKTTESTYVGQQMDVYINTKAQTKTATGKEQ